MDPNSPLSLAINAAETAGTNLSSADTTQVSAQAKFDAAQSAKNVADKADTDALADFNASMDALAAAALASKVTRTPAPAPAA